MAQSIYEQLEIPEKFREASIRKDQGEFISELIKKNNLKKTLEVGFAYGCSAAYIIHSTRNEHIAIDPVPEGWGNIGFKNLEKLGLLQHLKLIKDKSHNALPRLLEAGTKLDFAFIDGCHLFEYVMVDFHFIDQMLEERGYIMFDDAWMRSTELIASYLRTNRKDYREIKELPLNTLMFQKIGKDSRIWYYFREFYSLKNLIVNWRIMWKNKKRWDKEIKGRKY